MNNLIEKVEKEQIKKLTSKKTIPAFRTGDTIKVTLKIIEGERSRLQAFEGMCIARKNNSINSNFTIRKLSHGEGIERVFPLFSPNIDKIEVIRKGDVKRSKLYFLRNLKGKKARIADRDRGEELDEYIASENAENDNKDNQEITDDKLENNNDQKEKNVSQAAEQTVEEKKSLKEESESTASTAEKTDDESK
tara:strand:- start:365 stop:943 length:579 start_codon:yes stop_codon:yes gene_type:complete